MTTHTPLARPPRVFLYALQSLPLSPFCSSICSSEYKSPRPAGAHEITPRRPLCAPTSILFSARHLRCPRITTRRPKSPSPRVALQDGHHPSPRGPSNKLLYALTHVVALKTHIALHHVSQPRSTPITTWNSQRPRVPPPWSSADYLVKYPNSRYYYIIFLHCASYSTFLCTPVFFCFLCVFHQRDHDV